MPIDPLEGFASDLPDLPGGPLPTIPTSPSILRIAPEDRDAAIRTIWGEAAGGSPEEVAAVANVIRNRAQATGRGARDIVLEKGQFEPWDRPDRRAAMEALSGEDYAAIARVADPILRGEVEDITGGATHFYAPEAQRQLGRQPPSWATGPGNTFGRQRFYNIPYGSGVSGTEETFGVDIDPNTPVLGAMGVGADPLAGFASDLPDVDPLAGFASDLPDVPAAFGSISRGKARLDAGETLLTRAIADGMGLAKWDPVELGKTISEYKAIEAQSPPSEAVKAGQEAYAAVPPTDIGVGNLTSLPGLVKGAAELGPLVSTLASHPSFVASAIGESLPTMISTLKGTILGMAAGGAIGLAGGPIGVTGGGLAGASIGSGYGDAAMELLGYIEKKANPQTQEDWTKALSDPFLVNEALWAGVKHGGIVGLTDLIGMKVGGKIAGKFLVPGTTKAEKVLGIGGGFATSFLTEGAGEAGGELAAYGQVDPKEVLLEAVVGGLVGGPVDLAAEPALNLVKRMGKTVETGAEVGDVDAALAELPGLTVGEAPISTLEPPISEPTTREEVIHTTPTPREQVDALITQAKMQRSAPVSSMPQVPTTEEAPEAAKRVFDTPMTIERKKRKGGFRIVEGGEEESTTAQRDFVEERISAPVEGLRPQNRQLHKQSVDLARALLEVADKIGINIPLRVDLTSHIPGNDAAGMSTHTYLNSKVFAGRERLSGKPTKGRIEIAIDSHRDTAHVWSTMTHELGHIFVRQSLSTAPRNVQSSLLMEFRNWRRSVSPTDGLRATIIRRDSAVATSGRKLTNVLIHQLNPGARKYWLSYDEFLAEQFARWATTSEKPITIAEKWLSRIGRQLSYIFEKVMKDYGVIAAPNPDFKKWLDRLLDNGTQVLAAGVYGDLNEVTAQENASAQRSDGYEGVPVPRSVQMTPAVEMVYSLFGGAPPPQVKSAAAQADRLTRFGEWALSIQQLAKRNKDIRDLQHYREDEAVMRLEVQQYMQKVSETLRLWNNLLETQSDKLVNFLDDYSNMTYLTPDEVKLKVVRKPTLAERDAMIRSHGLSAAAVKVFGAITGTFEEFLKGYEDVLTRDAAKITDPAQKAAAMASIAKRMADYRKTPYFPWMRFGDYVVVVRNAAKHVVQREHYDSERKQFQAQKALKAAVPHDHTVSGFLVPKTARAFVGMPPGLLDKIAEKLGKGGHLTPAQQKDLEMTLQQLRFDYAPTQSFKHRFQRKSRTKGYSKNFKRAFANYGFYGSRHLARVKYVDQLRQYIDNVKEQAKFMPAPMGNVRAKIGNFMQDHLDEMLNPHQDFANLRGLTFFWYLGWMPTSASLNLLQILITTYPHLASKFGDVPALAVMMKEGASLSTYYKKSTLENTTDRELKMLGELSKEGLISEARAPELAALSEDRNLLPYVGNARQKMMALLSKSGAFLFSHTEQALRRVTARSTLTLALAYPDNAYVKESVRENELHQARLLAEGWTEAEAAAIVTAADAVKTTQFEYAREAQPKFMRGRKRTLFAFKTFQQNMLFFLGNYPAAAVRSLLVMGFLGGLMGLPGVGDLADLLKGLASLLFGKDFDLEREAREFVIEATGMQPDLAMHGASRYGFGIPAALDMLGGTVGIDVPFPTLDRSRAMGLGRIIPIPMAQALGANVDPNKAIADITQESSGAAFGLFFNMWRALQDIQTSGGGIRDFKNVERALPKILGQVSKAGRYYSEGMERTRDGAAVARFDPMDTEHMAEVLAVAMGYQPLRVTKEWEAIMAKAEVTAYWNLRRGILLRQADVAYRNQDQDSIDSVIGAIKNFNTDLPTDAKGKAITSKILRQSLQTRARLRAQKEAGIPVSKQDYSISTEIERLFPEATGPGTVSARRVK